LIRPAFALTLLVAPLLAAAAQQHEDNAPVLAITGATVLNVRTGEHIRNAVLIIEDDRIASVGQRSQVRIPRTARVVDASGRWIIPGLFDMHVHGSSRLDVPLELYVANGVTAVRDLGGNLAALRLTRQALQSGERIGPRLFFVGPLLDGNPPMAPSISIIADTPERGTSAVEFLVDQNVDSIKVYNGIEENILESIVRTAHRSGVPVAGHVPRAITAQRSAEIGLDVIEHAAIRSRDLQDWDMLTAEEAARISSVKSVTEREALVWQRLDLADARVRALASQLAMAGVFLDPTLSIDEYDTLFLYEQQATHPNNRFLARSLVEEALGPDHDVFRMSAALRSIAVTGLRKRAQFVGMCSRAGVRIVAGTDGPGIGTLAPGFGLHRELALLVVSAGLSPLEALRAATLHAAQALRKDAQLGAIEPGKLADLVILDADPLTDIQNTGKISGVVQGGKMFDRAALDQILATMEAKQRE
jgi:imidazolonepropionase-like amidohydrolase